MSIIYPDKINNMCYNGSILNGNIISVGVDGLYPYDYLHPQTAINAASPGDIILIYPGDYAPVTSTNVILITKSLYIRGMGNLVTDVTFTTPTTIWHPIEISSVPDNTTIVIENLSAIGNRSGSGALVLRENKTNTVVYANKLHLSAPSGYTVYFADSIAAANYKGNAYLTNCTIQSGSYSLRGVGSGSTTSIISFRYIQYINSYSCYGCSRAPSPHVYTQSYVPGYGHSYGDYLLTIVTNDEVYVQPTKKKNIWAREPYIYKITTSGINILDKESTDFIKCVNTDTEINSVWVNDSHIFLATYSGIYRCSSDILTSQEIEQYKTHPYITSDCVEYLHGNGDYLCAVTSSGIDSYDLMTGDRVYLWSFHLSKCFQMDNGDFYYTKNPFLNVIGLDENVSKWVYCLPVELSDPIPENNYQLLIEIPYEESVNSIRQRSRPNGIDIRIMNEKGEVVPHFIESWEQKLAARVWVKLSKDDKKFYILYCNIFATDQSDGEGTFRLFDDFDQVTLSGKWEFYGSGYSGSTYSIANSKIRFNTTNNSYPLYLVSSSTFPGGVIEYKFRMIPGTYSNTDLDWEAKFVGGVSTYIGCTAVTDESRHYMSSASTQGIIAGQKLTSTDFKVHTIVESLNYQMSGYDGETLVSSGTLLYTEPKHILFTYNNDSNNPNIEIDWVRVRNYDHTPPTYTFGNPITTKELCESAHLCVVYKGGGSYEYPSDEHGMINASYISDIYVTKGTSQYDNGNTIFLATSWGARAIEEKRGDELNGNKRIYLLDS